MQPESGRYQLEKAVAVEAVREAAQLCRRVQKGRVLGAALVKGDRSPVTIADFGAQAIVSRRLAQRFASDPVMGEESAAELVAPERASIRDAVCAEVAASIPGAKASDVLAWIGRAQSDGGRGRFWALDPIDGTKGFLR
ncbi:MAG TPA: inositol monophosphatase family protein, partial [Planctomycetota bacterium]|nr:inositol monophosphatase family protein [Planctomycetota bacterium]